MIKKAKGTKKNAINNKLKFETQKYFLEAYQLENKIKHLEKKKNDLDSLKKNHKKFIKNKKSILKIQQKFKSEEINKIVLNSNDDKRIHSIDLIEIQPYGMTKDLISEKEKTICKNLIKRYKNDQL